MLYVEFLTVGTIPKGPFLDIASEYQKFLSKYARVTNRPVKTDEGILERVDKTSFLIVLEADGKQLTSEAFAAQIRALEDVGRKVTVILGGPHGLSQAVKAEADLLLSLSKMTTTHDLAHLFFLEQLFRALAIVHGSDYHK